MPCHLLGGLLRRTEVISAIVFYPVYGVSGQPFDYQVVNGEESLPKPLTAGDRWLLEILTAQDGIK
jgi:hypothetical protein